MLISGREANADRKEPRPETTDSAATYRKPGEGVAAIDWQWTGPGIGATESGTEETSRVIGFMV